MLVTIKKNKLEMCQLDTDAVTFPSLSLTLYLIYCQSYAIKKYLDRQTKIVPLATKVSKCELRWMNRWTRVNLNAPSPKKWHTEEISKYI